jgi:hypothetical protein
MNQLNREYLIGLCERAVVPCTEWDDRDSASAQYGIEQIHCRLLAGIPYEVEVSDNMIWIQFNMPTAEQMRDIVPILNIDTVSDFREQVDPEYNQEMFEPAYADKDEAYSHYMPTEERLNETSGSDWY